MRNAMSHSVIVHGRYVGRVFIPDGPLPDAEGEAELVITPATTPSNRSIADAFGTATVLRSGEAILAEVHGGRDEWSRR